MPDSSGIDDAIVSKLVNDATLTALMPDGVYFNEASQAATKFVIVSVVDEADVDTFGGRAYEDALYLVKAVEKSSSGVTVKSAAARIDVLLAEQSLTASGYTWMSTAREGRIRYAEVDEVDASIRWQHCGANYRVRMSLG